MRDIKIKCFKFLFFIFSSLFFLSIALFTNQEDDLRVIFPKPDSNAKDVFTKLILLKEIKDGFRKEMPNYFGRISSICVDDEGNLYVADGKHKRIFKFSKDGEFIKTIGRNGQGPGEFMDEFMEISFGNDKKIYIVDNVRLKIIVYDKNGKLIKELKSPFRMLSARDRVAVNGKGEMFLYSRSGLKVIDRFDPSMNLKESYFDIEFLKEFTFAKPRVRFTGIITSPALLATSKVITPDDHLIVIFPYSQKIVEMDEKGNIVNEFYLRHPRFLKEYKEEIEEIEKEKPDYDNDGNPIYSFHAGCKTIFLDGYGNICISCGRIYCYRRDGKFMSILSLEGGTIGDIKCAFEDRFYSVKGDIKIAIFRGRVNK